MLRTGARLLIQLIEVIVAVESGKSRVSTRHDLAVGESADEMPAGPLRGDNNTSTSYHVDASR